MPLPVVDVRNISKRYHIGARHHDRQPGGLRRALASFASNPIRALRGRAPEEFWALRDVSLSINEGDVIGIIGRNGAGKSTLLKIISQITSPSSGEVSLRGRVASLLEVGTGFHPELTGLENIYLNGAILGMSRSEINRKLDSIIEFSEVERFLNTPTKRYSSGMAVRLAFAIAAHLEPEILVVDEVLAVGDTAFQKKCIGKMGEVAKRGRTVLFVSHNLSTINSLCDKAALLSEGAVDSTGPKEEIVGRYLSLLAESSRIRLGDRTDREGNSRLKLLEVELGGEKELGAGIFVSGGSATIRFRYQGNSKDSIPHVGVAMSLSDPSGNQLTDFSNYYVGDDWAEIPPEGVFECTIPKLPFMPGTYSFNIFVRVNGIVADWVLNAGQFTVEAGPFFPTGRLLKAGQGSLLVEHRWDVHRS
jgi:lipopolysaccharide transport system ATP-binding protein